MSHKRKKHLTKKDRKIEYLSDICQNNTIAIQEYEQHRKRFSIHDIKTIKPKNHSQKQMVESYLSGRHIIATGTAGTGKTFLGLYLALLDVLDNSQPQEKIIIVRSVVPTRNIGFLPGTESEKTEPYKVPYRDILSDILGHSKAFDVLEKNGQLEFVPTSHVRGLTWDNAVILMDECQNMTLHEINSIVTRTGISTKIIAIGDSAQTDLSNSRLDVSGFDKMVQIWNHMGDSCDTVHFTHHDIVRSQFVKKWLTAMEDC